MLEVRGPRAVLAAVREHAVVRGRLAYRDGSPADVFLQPAGQTATTQMSMCCRCALLVSDVPSHRALFVDNGYLINEQTTLPASLLAIAREPEALTSMKQRSLTFARQHLDYTQLARRIAAPATH